MNRRNFYLAVQSFGSTRHSLSGFNVELHVFGKLSDRDAYYNQVKNSTPWLFVCRVGGREYVRDKYYHRPVIVYCAEESIRHGTARYMPQDS